MFDDTQHLTSCALAYELTGQDMVLSLYLLTDRDFPATRTDATMHKCFYKGRLLGLEAPQPSLMATLDSVHIDFILSQISDATNERILVQIPLTMLFGGQILAY